METNWAAENLQTIRTLMERSAVYRRALAPIMTFAGVMGILGGVAGWKFHFDSDRGFILFWMGVAAITMVGAFLLVRRQALKDSEPLWSPPTRRVAQALLPPVFIGFVLSGAVAIWFSSDDDIGPPFDSIFIVLWSWLFGCAIHSAGFFMPRGIRWLGWIFITVGFVLLGSFKMCPQLCYKSPHLMMAGIFGGIHLAYGIYLYFTEKRGNES